ncbi:MAG TPA: elongation factor G [Nitrospira sp.]|nr:elongation factor G [Nitrospira sp.]
MNELRAASLRNVAVVGSRGAGKTSLAEAMLFSAGAIPAMGSVAQGTSVSDFEPEEQHRKISVSASLLRLSWNQTTITLLDTPGSLSLLGEPLSALEAADAVLVVVTLGAGVRSELLRLWSRIRERRMPCLMFINEPDKTQASLDELLDACRRDLGVSPILMTSPIEQSGVVDGVVDLLEQTAVYSRPDQAKGQTGPVPDAVRSSVDEGRKRMQEAVAEADDALLERYLSAGELAQDDLLNGLRNGVLAGTVMPVYVGSALKNIGIVPLLQGIKDLLPSPEDRRRGLPLIGTHPQTGGEVVRRGNSEEPFSGLIFKTIIDPFVGRLSYIRILSGVLQTDSMIYNASRKIKEKSGHLYVLVGKKHQAVPSAAAGDIVAIGKLKDAQTGDTLCEERDPVCYAWPSLPRPVLSFAIEPKSSSDVDKVSLGLHKLIEEDPTLDFSRNADTKEMVLSGLGQLHLDLALEKLHRKYGADVVIHTPKIPYRETIRGSAQAQGKYKKQTGGHGQYGDCWLELTPLERGAGFLFENRIVGGVIPRNFIPAVEKGVVEVMHHGTLAGFPVVDVKVSVYDGSYHVVDSSEMSFKIAASMAFKKAMESAHPVLLEPMMTVEVEAPAENIGAVIGDLNGRRGRILHVEAKGHTEVIKALVPLSEILTYTTTLNALTGGGGSYVMEFTRYEEVPRESATKIVEEHKAARQNQTVAAQ